MGTNAGLLEGVGMGSTDGVSQRLVEVGKAMNIPSVCVATHFKFKNNVNKTELFTF